MKVTKEVIDEQTKRVDAGLPLTIPLAVLDGPIKARFGVTVDRQEYQRKYRQLDKYKEYLQSDKYKESRRKYLQSDKYKESRRKYLQSDKYKEHQKKYYLQNRDRILARQRERYAKQKSVTAEPSQEGKG